MFDTLKANFISQLEKQQNSVCFKVENNLDRLFLCCLFQCFSIDLGFIYFRLSNEDLNFHVVCIIKKNSGYGWEKEGKTHHIVVKRWALKGCWTILKNDCQMVLRDHSQIYGSETIWWGNIQIEEKEIISSLKFFNYYEKRSKKNLKKKEKKISKNSKKKKKEEITVEIKEKEDGKESRKRKKRKREEIPEDVEVDKVDNRTITQKLEAANLLLMKYKERHEIIMSVLNNIGGEALRLVTEKLSELKF